MSFDDDFGFKCQFCKTQIEGNIDGECYRNVSCPNCYATFHVSVSRKWSCEVDQQPTDKCDWKENENVDLIDLDLAQKHPYDQKVKMTDFMENF